MCRVNVIRIHYPNTCITFITGNRSLCLPVPLHDTLWKTLGIALPITCDTRQSSLPSEMVLRSTGFDCNRMESVCLQWRIRFSLDNNENYVRVLGSVMNALILPFDLQWRTAPTLGVMVCVCGGEGITYDTRSSLILINVTLTAQAVRSGHP